MIAIEKMLDRLNWSEQSIIQKQLAEAEINANYHKKRTYLSEAEQVYEERKQQEIEAIAIELKTKELIQALKQKQGTCTHKHIKQEIKDIYCATVCTDCGVILYIDGEKSFTALKKKLRYR